MPSLIPAPSPAFTPAELETLLSIFDTLIPPISASELLSHMTSPPAAAIDKTLDLFASDCPSRNPAFTKQLQQVLPRCIPAQKMQDLKGVLRALRGAVGSLLLVGSLTPFHELPRHAREAVLLSWKLSRISVYRRIFDSFSLLCFNTYLRVSPAAHAAMGYALNHTRAPKGAHYKFEFAGVDTEWSSFCVDAVVVGSGSGGGVVARMLAEAGMRVVVVEKGVHVDHGAEAATSESEALETMYESGGYSSVEGNVALVAGSTFGGGTTVNWAACLQPPAAVRRDWANNHGLEYFASDEFQDDLDSVCEYMGVCPPTGHNAANTALLEGARRLGFAAQAVPQNTGNGPHACGSDCANGCRSGHKKGGVNSWLADASRAGAHFVTSTHVSKLVFSSTCPSRVVGVMLQLPDGTESLLPTPRVIVSAGSLHTPALLLRSGLRNPNIGATLHMHPTSHVHVVHPQPTQPTRGNILTAVVTEHANLTATGHGVRIEASCMNPAISCTTLPWRGGASYKAALAQHSHLTLLISMARDRIPGRVSIDPLTGAPRVAYTVSAFDAGSILTGVVCAAETMLAAGAAEVLTCYRGVEPLRSRAGLKEWVRALAVAEHGMYGSAHQMASARMGIAEQRSVVDHMGAVWGVEGAWVADASCLPSAAGVNPMVTTMAVARRVARGVVEAWRRERGA